MVFFLGTFMGDNLGDRMALVLSLSNIFFIFFISILSLFFHTNTICLFISFPYLPPFLTFFPFKKNRCTLILEIGNAHYNFLIFLITRLLEEGMLQLVLYWYVVFHILD